MVAGTARDLTRILSHTEPDGECLIWTGVVDHAGYGLTTIAGRRKFAHRAVWILHHGPIGPGVFICHRCDNPSCVRIEHLFAGDHIVNMKDMAAKGRGSNQRKTHCPKGHPYSGTNLAIEHRAEGTDRRRCRTCNAEKTRRYKARRAAVAPW